MITRAQAEALLTLAESLEACERLGLKLTEDFDGVLSAGAFIQCGTSIPYVLLEGMDIRLMVNLLTPKQEITYTLNWEERP